jgi:hypothetical protein
LIESAACADFRASYFLREGLPHNGIFAIQRACPINRVPAAEIERAVIDQLRVLLRSPEIIVATWRAARKEIEGLTEMEVRDALERLDPLWDELFPAEQARIVRLLVERVDIDVEGIDVRLRIEGLVHLARDVAAASLESARAA